MNMAEPWAAASSLEEELRMVSKGVLHKKNGYRAPPATEAPSPGEVIRLVHSDRGTAPSTYDLLKFVQIVSSERSDALSDQAVREIDGLRSSLSAALRRTEEAFERGELADVRRILGALQARADLAARIVGQLAAVVDGREARRRPEPEGRRVLDLNGLVAEILAQLRSVPGAPAVTDRLAPDLPRIVGDPAELRRVLGVLLAPVDQGQDDGAAARRLIIETSRHPGALQGEETVRLEVTHEGLALPERGLDLSALVRIVAEHGGAVTPTVVAGFGIRIRLELPAV